jgi:hypothetical protein
MLVEAKRTSAVANCDDLGITPVPDVGLVVRSDVGHDRPKASSRDHAPAGKVHTGGDSPWLSRVVWQTPQKAAISTRYRLRSSRSGSCVFANVGRAHEVVKKPARRMLLVMAIALAACSVSPPAGQYLTVHSPPEGRSSTHAGPLFRESAGSFPLTEVWVCRRRPAGQRPGRIGPCGRC